MKILMITDTYNPKSGGAEKYYFNLIKELKKRGHEIFSLGFNNDIDCDGTDDHQYVLKETESLFIRHLWRVFFNPYYYLKMRSFVKKVDPDLIHIHNINKYTISLIRALRGYPIIHTVHDYGLVCPTLWNVHNDYTPCPTGLNRKCLFRHRRNYNFLIYLSMLLFFFHRNRLLKQHVTRFLTPAPQLQSYLEKNKFQSVYHLPNIIDITNDKPHFNEIEDHTLLYFGKLSEEKGIQRLIEEMHIVKSIFPDVTLSIIGCGDEEDTLKRQVKELNLQSSIFFKGFVDDGTLIDHLKRCSIVLCPSIWMENAPLTIQEAMMFYRPVIGSKRGGIPWLISDKKTGLVIEPLHHGEMSKAIQYLLENKEEIKAYGSNAYQRLTHLWSTKELMDNLQRHYHTVIKDFTKRKT